ncbi:sensor histidine kinase [Isoptericola aurantiacus]|uniref:sensor histidine kinase n=1 Tax=Isoptericola aurantiacus TaxID=3377839 RepID=UPI00383B9E1F
MDRPDLGGTDRGPLDRRRPRIFLAVALGVVVTVGTVGASHWRPGDRPLDVLGVGLVLVSPVAVAALARRPVPAVLTSTAAVGAYLAFGYAWGPVLAGAVGVLVAVLLTGPPRRARALAWSGAVVCWGAVVAAAGLRADAPSPAVLLGGAAWTAVALLLAGAIRERFTRAAAQRAARAERERSAVATERLRIARELHDVLAHSLSAITVQSGVGLHLLDRDPEQARTALTAIRATSRDALDEVRAVLQVVRAQDGAVEAGAPVPGPTWDLSTLPGLADPLRARGVVVTFDLPSENDVPPHVAGIVYRVVQEALTNISRHAPRARSVVVHVRADPGGVQVRVSDDGAGAPGAEVADGDAPDPGTPDGTPGHGLLGMRERVEGAGGTLRTGRDGHGFVVTANIPGDRP